MKKLLIFFIFMWTLILPCYSKTIYNVELISDVPEGIDIKMTVSNNSFDIKHSKTSKDLYYLAINDAVIELDNGSVHRLVEPLPFRNYSQNMKIKNKLVFNFKLSLELAPIENLRFSKNLPMDCSPVFLIDLNDKKSVLHSVNNALIKIPVLNDTTGTTSMLVFKVYKRGRG